MGMTIGEMHVWFRQYAQQMGMQNVRAILPEQIDRLINTSTLDIIDEVINKNIGTTNDKIITDNAKLASINALRTLTRVNSGITVEGTEASFGDNNIIINAGGSSETDVIGDTVLYIVDFAVKYGLRSGNSEKTTHWFPVRIIDNSYLADVLNDWVLAPRLRSPIIVVYTNGDTSTYEFYRSNPLDDGNPDGISISGITLRCTYIKKPETVKFLDDLGGDSVDSDLPDQLQVPMLKHAVDLYRASVSGSLFATQQQNENQQREMVRNNARPDNEGYQS